MNIKHKNMIIKILNNSTNFEDFKKKIISLNINDECKCISNLSELRKNTKDKNEYQKLTYQMNKENKPQITTLEIYGQKKDVISSKTFYINIMKYSKIPANKFLTYFKNNIVFISKIRECDCCLFDSVIDFLCKSCEQYYDSNTIIKFLKNDNFDIFTTPADFMRLLNLSSTKSLRIRIEKYNKTYPKTKIIPFKFNIDNQIKVLYLKRDIEKLYLINEEV